MKLPLPQLPKWALYSLLAVLMLLGGIGTCAKLGGSLGSLCPQATPAPKPNPSDVWNSLPIPSQNKVNGLELPAPMEVAGSRKFVVIAAQCTGPVRWLVSSATGKQVDVLESKLTNSIMILPNGNVEDNYVVLAYTTVDNLPSDSAITFVHVKPDIVPPKPGPGPGPSPGPLPSPGPILEVKPEKASHLHVTYLLDFSKQQPASINSIINDPLLRKLLSDAGHQVHELSIKDLATPSDPDPFGLQKFVKGKYPPFLVIQGQAEPGVPEGHVFDVLPLTTVQGVKDAVAKYTK